MIRKGATIGPYTLLEKLGRGGFGVVWLAEKRTALTVTKVALKIPNDDDVELDAIRREAEVWVAASGHPNVLSIIDADIYDDLVVIVSEYAPDGSLEKYLQRQGGRMPTIADAVAMTDGILAGLEHLHARRIIHRDLKPANVLLQGQTPRLVDFGLARVMKSSSHSKTVSGTYAYMPPETFSGNRSEQTDIWSAGVILYEMLTGRLPFPTDNDAALIGSILHGAAEPLPDYINPHLRSLVGCALDKDLGRRFQTAAAMRGALKGLRETMDAEATRIRGPVTVPVQPGQTNTHPEWGAKLTARPLAPPVAPPPPVHQSRPQFETEVMVPPPVQQHSSGPPTIPSVNPIRPLMQSANHSTSTVTLPQIGIGLGLLGLVLAGVVLVSAVAYFVLIRPAGTGGTGAAAPEKPGPITAQQDMEFVPIAAGEFLMGAAPGETDAETNEAPQHLVTISTPFYLSKYEVTQEQWRAVMGSEPSKYSGCPRCPVDSVSWNDVQIFIGKLNSVGDGYIYRLPTEAEWEYACRAGTTGPFAFGNKLSAKEANFDGNYPYGGAATGVFLQKTVPVGSYEPNSWGLYDMHGNVREWCADAFVETYVDTPRDGSVNTVGPDPDMRVLRGGSWNSYSKWLRSAKRDGVKAETRQEYYGFRLALTKRIVSKN